MAVLFVSHSAKDDAHATALESWLKANGFTEVFVDHESLVGGDKWREALRSAASSCRVVIYLVTENWLASSECFNEFMAAWYMGRRNIPLLLLAASSEPGEEARQRLARVLGEDQGIDLAPCLNDQGVIDLDANQAAAKRLKAGLQAAGANTRVGLDPEAFAIDVGVRPTPFPGLASFGDDDADAALFYGRSREIADTLVELRKMRAERDLRPLVILGASGAGKSSLLKAGIIPRLRREAPAWLPLRAFRPGADPLLNFAEAVSHTLADFGDREAHGLIRDRLLEAWRNAERNKGELTAAGLTVIDAALQLEGQRLRNLSNRPGASILVSVDQAEEMARAEGESGEALADYLRVALSTTKSSWQLAFTIRTDSFPELQKHRRFQDLKARGYDLRAIPVFRFDSVVEEPAKRYGVNVEPLLVDALMEDAPKEDALPLLAFALQRLWRLYAGSGSLIEGHYRRIGGLNGMIEDAAERALRGLEPEQDVPLPAGPLRKRLADLGLATFVPMLVQINDQGTTIRRVAHWAQFTEEQQDLLSRLDRWRLVVRKGIKADSGTVEVAHEALFREWTRLKKWVDKERQSLEAKFHLETDADRFYRADKRRQSGFLLYGARLREARRILRLDRGATYLSSQATELIRKSKAARRNIWAWLFLFFGIYVMAALWLILLFPFYYFDPALPISIANGQWQDLHLTRLIPLSAALLLPPIGAYCYTYWLHYTAQRARKPWRRRWFQILMTTGFVLLAVYITASVILVYVLPFTSEIGAFLNTALSSPGF